MSKFMRMFLFAAMVIALSSTMAFAEEPLKIAEPTKTAELAKIKETTVPKSVTGIVSGVSRNFIAVEYGIGQADGAALEMAFDVNKSVKLVNKRNIKDINIGDTVAVDYDKITRTNPEGKVILSKHVAKAISFIRPAPKEAESEVLGAGEQE